LPLHVCTTGSNVRQITFRFRYDSGAEITAMSVRRAQIEGIPIPNTRMERTVLTASGQARLMVREGSIRAFLPGWARQQPNEWPCLFVEDQSEDIPPLLGLFRVIEDLRLTQITLRTGENSLGKTPVQPDSGSGAGPNRHFIRATFFGLFSMLHRLRARGQAGDRPGRCTGRGRGVASPIRERWIGFVDTSRQDLALP
jgi:hypothetical protein